MLRMRRFLLLLSLLGPAIITSNIDNDAGGIAIYSIAGARYGYNLLWTLIPTVFVLIILQEMGSRMGMVTGKGLADLIRENNGIRAASWVMVSLFLTNLGNTMAEFSGWAASMELFNVSKYISIPIGAFFVWFLVTKWNYSVFEKIFLAICFIYATYIVSAFLAKPDWGEVAHKTITPSIEWNKDYLIILVSIIGTSITPWQQFYLQAGVVEKGLNEKDWWASRIDVIFGAIMMGLVAFFIIVACGATLFPAGIRIESAEEAALSLKPLAGKHAYILFAVGLANASLFSACILPLSTTYYICEAMGWETGTGRRFKEAPQFMSIFTILLMMGASIIMIPNIPLIKVMWFSQIINCLLLPVILIFMLLLINKTELMGEMKNSLWMNIVAYTSTVVLIILNTILLYNMFSDILR
ncbi:MAG: Divalent metal cation transporter MntH [Syntrophorhabdus sp. PtaU1.Bin002]|nr:MAG: Divalent metal cation transporter MntH [Syntrophorhabdus sp. PtaU1.Bin002]